MCYTNGARSCRVGAPQDGRVPPRRAHGPQAIAARTSWTRARFAFRIAAPGVWLAALAASAMAQTAGEPRGGAGQPAGAKPAPPSPPDAARLLMTPIAEVSFDEAPLEQALDWIGQVAGTNVVVRWSALEALGVERDQPITVRARRLTLARLLWLTLAEAGGTDVKLGYRADPDMILVSTAEELRQRMIVKAYDVRDLLMTIPIGANFESVRNHTYVASNGRQGATTEVISGGTRFFEEGQNGQQRFDDEQEQGVAEIMQRLLEVITTTVEPESWDVAGGPGSVRPWRGRIVVRNSAFVHQKLAGRLTTGDAP